jgi:hypothetical protein
MNDDPALMSATSVALSTSAILAALVFYLKRKDLLSEREEREVYEFALQMLEQNQGDGSPKVFEMAREVIEEHLRPKP